MRLAFHKAELSGGAPELYGRIDEALGHTIAWLRQLAAGRRLRPRDADTYDAIWAGAEVLLSRVLYLRF